MSREKHAPKHARAPQLPSYAQGLVKKEQFLLYAKIMWPPRSLPSDPLKITNGSRDSDNAVGTEVKN